MKIAIVGYGRMGHIIEEVARGRGHEIVCTIDQGEEEKFSSPEFLGADAAIEFSVPGAAVGNLKHCIGAKVPVVCGTTGWLQYLPEIADMCLAEGGRLIHATNFSIGVNLFWAFNRYMAQVFSKFPEYKPTLSETHHVHKLDHPSGTAITTAEMTVGADTLLKSWRETDAEVDSDVLAVHCERRGEVPGIHSMMWDSADDFIELTHSAKSRRGFAEGAVLSAEWLVKQNPAMYGISDMLANITHTAGIFK